MSKSVRPRRFIAVFAAYTVALQALLLPLSVAIGGPLGNTLCGASVEGSPSPVSHESGCPCAAGCGMQCCIHALGGPPEIAVAIAEMHVGAVAPAPYLAAVSQPNDRRGPQIPRAPPV
jgi:hypothetical protein